MVCVCTPFTIAQDMWTCTKHHRSASVAILAQILLTTLCNRSAVMLMSLVNIVGVSCLFFCPAQVKGEQPDGLNPETAEGVAPHLLHSECAEGGAEACQDVLSFLQMNSTARMQATAPLEESPYACTSGLVGKVRDAAPDCIDSCPQSCQAIALVAMAYLMKGREERRDKGDVPEQGRLRVLCGRGDHRQVHAAVQRG
jgi:hypothetical protein